MLPHRCRPVASAGWCHDRRLFRGRYGIYRQPRRGDLGASVLVRAGCGEGECGGARLVGSEKSPIVTRRWCVGLGGLIENVLSRRGLRCPPDDWGRSRVVWRIRTSSARNAVLGTHRSESGPSHASVAAAPRPTRIRRRRADVEVERPVEADGVVVGLSDICAPSTGS